MTHGMVCAPQPEAVEAGALALMRGGNAVDTAMTCALVQTVVDPLMCGIAGFGSMQLFLPKRGHHGYIDFHTTAPAAATPDMWLDQIESQSRDGFGFILKNKANEVGYESIMTPGSLKAYYEAIETYGTMDWKDIIQPAIDHAEEGFTVRPHFENSGVPPTLWTVWRWSINCVTLARLGKSTSTKTAPLTRSGQKSKIPT